MRTKRCGLLGFLTNEYPGLRHRLESHQRCLLAATDQRRAPTHSTRKLPAGYRWLTLQYSWKGERRLGYADERADPHLFPRSLATNHRRYRKCTLATHP